MFSSICGARKGCRVAVLFTAASMFAGGRASAQQTSGSSTAPAATSPDSLIAALHKLQTRMEALNRITISGWIQAQYQLADSAGEGSFAGGSFPANVDNRFAIRRARLRAAYNGSLTQFVLQINMTEKGLNLTDLYAKVTEPWTHAFSLTVGAQNRPFGYEVVYSSNQRESPERGRMSQLLFPNERDLGAMITFQMPKGKPLDFLKFEGGLFNGTGIPSPGGSVSDFDSKKDFIGRLRIDRTSTNNKITYGLGTSYYTGGWRNGTTSIWKMQQDAEGVMSFRRNTDTLNYGASNERWCYGFDGQLSIDWKAGLTTVRAEYIAGTQSSAAGNSAVTTLSPNAQPTTDGYVRHFNGMYLYLVQNIHHSKWDVVAKYDVYDPNTDVAGNRIGKVVHAPDGQTFTATNGADIKFSTIGLGVLFKLDANVKFTAYYDIVTNETTNAKNDAGAFTTAPYQHDLKDNVLTLRMQYKF